MQDEEISLSNTCADLLTERKAEAFPLHLLRSKRPGEWLLVRECCAQLGLDTADLGPELFATWLPHPTGQEGYAVILFYDDATLWSMAAVYNRGRLLNTGPAGVFGGAIGMFAGSDFMKEVDEEGRKIREVERAQAKQEPAGE